ncbi:hypothetical protein BC829DRAFT_381648, partial [Chytridium lagenaria]
MYQRFPVFALVSMYRVLVTLFFICPGLYYPFYDVPAVSFFPPPLFFVYAYFKEGNIVKDFYK